MAQSKGFLALLLFVSLPVSSQVLDSGAFIHPGSVKRVPQGIEATVTWTHSPIASGAKPDRSFNDSTLTMVVRCKDRTVAWKEWQQYQSYSGRELISTEYGSHFQPVESGTHISAAVDFVCAESQIASLPQPVRPTDANLPPLTLVCDYGTTERPDVTTYRVSFSEAMVNDKLAEITSSKISMRHSLDDGTVVTTDIDRYSGSASMMTFNSDGSPKRLFNGTCEKRTARAF